jgi:hypothetical protein
MRAGRGVWWSFVALAIVAGGCAADESGAGPPPTLAPVSTTDPVFAGVPAGSDVIGDPVVDVVVIDPGGEPRLELRLDPPVGSVVEMTTTIDQGFSVEVDGRVQAIPATTLEMDLTFTVDAVDAETITYRSQYVDVRAGAEPDPATAAAVDEIRAQFVGAESSFVMDRRGTIISQKIGVTGLPEISEEIVSQSTALSTPFPVEPVGLGARWDARSQLSSSGFVFNVSSIHEVVELDDDHVVTDVQLRMSLPATTQSVMGLPVRVDGGEIAGQGRMTWPFAQLVPVGTQNASGTIGMSASRGGQSVSLTMTMRQRFEQMLR